MLFWPHLVGGASFRPQTLAFNVQILFNGRKGLAALPRYIPRNELPRMKIDQHTRTKAALMSQADELLIAIVLKNTKVTQVQIDEALSLCEAAKQEGRDLDLAHSILEQNFLGRAELYKLVKARNYALIRQEDKRLGKRLFRKNFITKTQLDEALAFQRQLFKALGDIKRVESILVDDGHVSPEQVREVWSEYTGYLKRKGDAPLEPKTDPSLLKRG